LWLAWIEGCRVARLRIQGAAGRAGTPFLDAANPRTKPAAVTTTITGENQVTLPAELVRELGWTAGTRLDWQKLDGNALVARPLPSRGELLRQVMGIARAKPGSDPIADLQRMQEEEDRTL
jgi:bifunctional DNA-binding transcriptional regulator/antitoxin component of YhaV-PrlF toxin-antitoxin module